MTRKVLVLNADDVHRLLNVNTCIPLMVKALKAVSENSLFQPLRHVVKPPQSSGLIALMPSHFATSEALFGYKAVTVFHDNPKQNKDAHQGVVSLLDPETGELLCLADASAITRIRTAAATAVATDALAKTYCETLVVLGTGVQARAHIPAILAVRSLKKIIVCGRRYSAAQDFAEWCESSTGVSTSASDNVSASISQADIIVAATTSHEPVVHFSSLKPGVHVNAVGACIPLHRELDSATMVEACVFTDKIESLVNEAGEYVLAAQEVGLTESHLQGEVGAVLNKTLVGRENDRQITVFKSLGLSIEDIITVKFLYDSATDAELGQWVDF